MKKSKVEKAVANVQGKEVSQGNFLTILCAGQKITEPSKETMHSGTINIFNAYRGTDQKVAGLNLCKNQNRDEVFDSFGLDVPLKFGSVVFTLNRQTEVAGAVRRVINFKTEVEKISNKI